MKKIVFLALGVCFAFHSLAQMSEQEAQQFVKQKIASANAVGSVYDSLANGDLVLYDLACLSPDLVAKYPYFWVATVRGSGSMHSAGCYKVDLANKRILVFAPNDNRETPVPFANIGSGNSSNQQSTLNAFSKFLGALSSGISAGMDAANKYNQPVTNLTPGLTRGNNSMNCTPDGRGGYNCR
jgi:hypothetical protein